MVTSLESFHTTGSIINVKVNFSIPKEKWLAAYSTQYPNLHFNLLSTLSISKNRGSCILQINGMGLEKFWNDFSSMYDSKKYQIILHDEESLLMNMFFDSPWILWTIMEPQVIVLFPILIQDGKLSMDLIAPQKKIDEVFKKPLWKDLDLSLKFVGNFQPTLPLPKRQHRILEYALDYGLFDIPRRKSLTEAADSISEDNPEYKLSVSALSENLRKINKKLAESYMKAHDSPS